MTQPLVTVGVPVYNGERYLEATLRSLLGQHYVELEILVSDNRPTDSTREIASAYAAQDSRISLMLNAENLGAAPNYNRLLDAPRGTYFKWAAADDICEQTFAGHCVSRLEEDPELVLAFPLTTFIDARGRRAEAGGTIQWHSPRTEA